jgi:hypothetical protein
MYLGRCETFLVYFSLIYIYIYLFFPIRKKGPKYMFSLLSPGRVRIAQDFLSTSKYMLLFQIPL